MSIIDNSVQINDEINQTGTTPDYAYSPFSFITRCKGCNKNLTSNNPATRYQIQKLIQNTVRVSSGLYTMNLGALNVYQRPDPLYQVVNLGDATYIASPGVNWNQMSDRAKPHKQVVVSGNGLTGNSLKRTLTRLRPGALSPGGVGVDIKHNSYNRYLARIKGKAPLRRGPIPPSFASGYLPFNRAYPVYGGKLFKTSIVNNCNCPIIDNKFGDTIIYENEGQQIYNTEYKYGIGDIVLVIRDGEFVKAKVVSLINNDVISVLFLDNNITSIVLLKDVKLFIPIRSSVNSCNINPCIPILENEYKYKYLKDKVLVECVLFNNLEGNTISNLIN